MFWNRKHKKPVPECPASDTAVYLCPSGFYFDEKPIHPSCQMLSLYPHEIIEGDPTFLAFAPFGKGKHAYSRNADARI